MCVHLADGMPLRTQLWIVNSGQSIRLKPGPPDLPAILLDQILELFVGNVFPGIAEVQSSGQSESSIDVG